MANLGTIGTYNSQSARMAGFTPTSSTIRFPSPLAAARFVSAYRFATMAEWGAADATGSLSGSVTADTTPVVGARVCCYWRPSGAFVASVLTNAQGAFVIPLLDKASNEYAVVAYDPTGGVQYNAKVFDYLTPL